MPKISKYQIDNLRNMVKYFNDLNESFNQQFSIYELAKIWLFAVSKQGGLVHECADHWPQYLLDAVLLAEKGSRLPDELVKRAGELV